MRVYLDNASTTPMLPEVVAAMSKVMLEDFGNPSSIHSNGRKAKSMVENARRLVSQTINASVAEVFFTSSATEANNMILQKAVEDLGVTRIISSPIEHHCVLHTLEYLQKTKHVSIELLQVNALGEISLNDLISTLHHGQNQKTLVSLMHGNNEIGTMNDLTTIGAICQANGALFHSDTVQTIGKYPIDVQDQNIHFITGSAHKFHGPKGIGFVYISNQHMLSPMIHGGAQERNMRAGTENVVGIVGLSKALEIAVDNMEANRKYISNLKSYFANRLQSEFYDVLINGSINDNTLSHVLSVSFPPGPKADMLIMNLDIAGISASSASACSAGIEEDSHVLKAIGHPSQRKTIRFSFSTFNTIEDIDFCLEKLKTLTPIQSQQN